MNLLKSIILPLTASVCLTSCVVSDYPGGPVSGSVAGTFGFYDTLPDTYVGEAYYYRNRYYYGGTYQHGAYNYQGRPYNDRYYHNGQYFYGGRNGTYGNRVNQVPNRYDVPSHRSNGYYRGSYNGRNSDHR